MKNVIYYLNLLVYFIYRLWEVQEFQDIYQKSILG